MYAFDSLYVMVNEQGERKGFGGRHETKLRTTSLIRNCDVQGVALQAAHGVGGDEIKIGLIFDIKRGLFVMYLRVVESKFSSALNHQGNLPFSK